jgi:hypothetical protein
MAINMKNYKAAKAKGSISIIRLNEDKALISTDSYDPDTGEKLDPVVNQYSIKELETQQQDIQEQLTQLTEFITDLKKTALASKKPA